MVVGIKTPHAFSRMNPPEKLSYLTGLGAQFFGGNRSTGVPYKPGEGMPDPYRRMYAIINAARADEDPNVSQRGWQLFNELLNRLPDPQRR